MARPKNQPSLSKLLKIRVLLDNGLDEKEHWYRIEPTLKLYDRIKVGDFVMGRSCFGTNAAQIVRITAIHSRYNSSMPFSCDEIDQLPQIISKVKFNPLELAEGLEVC